jgi:hypothetical protein
MEKFQNLLRQKEFHIWFFFMCLIVFGMPLVNIVDPLQPETAFYYFCFTWGTVVFVLYLVARSLTPEKSKSENNTEKTPLGSQK